MSVFTIAILYLCLSVRMSGSLLSHNDIHDVIVPTTAATTSVKIPRNAQNSSNLEQLQTHPVSGSQQLPLHNFWPWIPVVGTDVDRDTPAQLFTFSKKLPSHNFWPWIPVAGTEADIDTPAQLFTFGKKLPSHNFWPWVPLRDFGLSGFWGNWTHLFRLPKHSFWPYVPITADDRNRKFPSTGPKLPRLPWPPSLHRYNYGEVLYKSILFYEVQRSGRLPSNRNIRWRGDSAVNDRGDAGEDLTGGWYDSGDYVKFGLPMASSVTMLLYGLLEFPEAYSSASLFDDVRDCVKWPLDYFLKAHTDKYGFYGQVGDPYVDHTYWGRPEDMTMDRPAYKLTPEQPGSDLIGETSAAMAAGYLAFKDVEPQYAERLLTHAQILFEFAENFRGYYSDSIPSAAEFYQSHSDEDELAWAAAWLYRATGHRRYLTKAAQWLRLAPACWAQSWADKTCGATVLLYQVTKAAGLREMVEQTFQAWLPGGGIHYTPNGLAYRDDWGTLRYTANMAFLSLVAAQTGVNSDLYRRWAMGQIHYMLGDSGRSFVVGFGKDPPTRPHHASSSCRSPPYPCNWDDYSKPEANAHTLYGALVGGPGPRDEYLDTREDYIHNEVSCEYNGGFQSAVAALRHLELNLL